MADFEILAFRADTRASKGLTAKHIAKAAEAYDAEKNPAPVVFGHPTSDSPALGIIGGARAAGNELFLQLKNVAEEVVQGVRDRKILNRSIAFWAPDHPSNPSPGQYSIRHLGFLGGMAPAIPNLPALKFSADEDVLESDEDPEAAVVFEAAEPSDGTPVAVVQEPAPEKESTMTEAEIQALQARADQAEKALADEKAASEAREKEFAATEKARRETENAATLDAAVAAGKVLPAERDDLAAIFNALPTTALTFSAGELEPRAALAAFVEGLPARSPVNTPTATPRKEFSADDSKAKADAALAAANAAISTAHRPQAAN